MAEFEPEGILTRQLGPAKLYQWAIGIGAAGLVIFKFMKGQSGSSGTTSGGADDQFTSSQDTQSTDANGNTVDSSFSASGSAPIPGFLTTTANPMPFSGGDVYVNVPAPTNTAGPPGPAGPAGPAAPAPASIPYTVTGKGDTNLSGLVTNFYHLKNDPREASVIEQAIVAVNPDRSTWGKGIPVGTQINLPANYAHGATTTLPNGQKTTASSTTPVK